jgi:hemerythrin superfamily protein
MTTSDTLRPDTDTEDIIAVLLHQHEMVKAAFTEIMEAEPSRRQEPFDRLRALLAMHETAEEMVLRPTTRSIGADDVADARNEEESEATTKLAALEDMGCDDPRFETELATFYQDVLTHAQAEESLEFPRILDEVPAESRIDMGRRLLAVEAAGPTHPHPSTAGSTVANWTIGPFAAMVDRVKDAFSSSAS